MTTVNRASKTVTVVAFTVRIPLSPETVFKLFVFCRCVPPNTGDYTPSELTPLVATRPLLRFLKWYYAGRHLSDSSFHCYMGNQRKRAVDTDRCCDNLEYLLLAT